MPDSAAPRVLAVAEDPRGLVSACRVHLPLFALKRLGLVADYWVTGPELTGVPGDFAFDVLWLQRARERRTVERVQAALGDAFLLDIDDLLIARPDYIEAEELPPGEHIRAAVRRCAVLTTTSSRLVSLLERRVGAPLADKAVVCPNALEFPAGWVRPAEEPPQGLLLTQSHRLALRASREAVFGAVRAFSGANRLPVYYFGPPLEVLGPGVPELVGEVIPCGYLDFWRYHGLLASLPRMIGVAPLETEGDQETLDFVAGKSDIKMVEYGGFGHPGVYSAAPPYVDTDIQSGAVAANTYEDWSAALARQLDGYGRSAAEQAAIARARSIDATAPLWRQALDRARLPHPIAAAVLTPLADRPPGGRLRRQAARARRVLPRRGRR